MRRPVPELNRRQESMSNSQQLYAGSYAAADQPGIYSFAFDAASGELIQRAAFAGIANPSFIAVHPNGRWLFAVSETSEPQDGAPGAVWALRLSPEHTGFESINQTPSGGDWPCHIEIDPSGRWLLVSNYASGSVGVLPI